MCLLFKIVKLVGQKAEPKH